MSTRTNSSLVYAHSHFCIRSSTYDIDNEQQQPRDNLLLRCLSYLLMIFEYDRYEKVKRKERKKPGNVREV